MPLKSSALFYLLCKWEPSRVAFVVLRGPEPACKYLDWDNVHWQMLPEIISYVTQNCTRPFFPKANTATAWIGQKYNDTIAWKIRVTKLFAIEADLKSSAGALMFTCGLVRIERIQTAKPTRGTFPSRGLFEVCTSVPSHIFTFNDSKEPSPLHKMGPAMCTVPPELDTRSNIRWRIRLTAKPQVNRRNLANAPRLETRGQGKYNLWLTSPNVHGADGPVLTHTRETF